ncbi:MAG: secondary thiamine-phosphate synthase enzyme YjbQ [Acidobacteriota bacterium]
MHKLSVSTSRREQMLDITAQLQELVRAHGWRDGLLQAHCPHTTAGLTVNENADPDVVRDMLATLARLVPERGDYRHAEGNSDAHLKSSCMGCGLTLIVSGGRIMLGTWQGVYFCEFDGPRSRQVWVSWLGQAG